MASGLNIQRWRVQPVVRPDDDGDIDIFDIVIAAGHYGEHW